MKHLLSFLFIFLVFVTQAQTVPQKINYQGVVRSANGNPIITTPITVRFRILQGSATGSVSFAETHTTSTNALGLFNLQIGSINTNLASVNWANGPYFLEVGIDTLAGNNYILLGTQQLVSVPYALQAGSAPSPPVSFSNNVLTVGTSTASITTSTANVNIIGINGATVIPSSQNYTIDVPQQLNLTHSGGGITSITNNTYPNVNIDAPSVAITTSASTVLGPFAGNGLLQKAGIYPNYTLYIAPNFVYSQVTGSLTMSSFPGTLPSYSYSYNITPSVTVTNNTIAVGPLSNYSVIITPPAQAFGSLNSNTLATLSGTSQVTNAITFNKLSSSSEIDVYLHAQVSIGSLSGGGGIIFELRIDGNPSTVSTVHYVSLSGSGTFITLRAVFAGLATGFHTISVWARTTPLLTATNIVIDPNNLGGKIIMKETY
jgi:hypothetical protein